MPAPRRSNRSSQRRTSSRFVVFSAGLLAGVLALGAALWAFGFLKRPLPAVSRTEPAPTPRIPQAPVAERPLEVEPQSAPAQPPFGISEDVFEAGATLYRAHCAQCHGVPGHPAHAADPMPRPALQLWEKHPGSAVVGVSGEPPGVIERSISQGNVRNGMPAYAHRLSTTQMWDIALLLKNADQALPEPVLNLLTARIPVPEKTASPPVHGKD